MKRIISMAVTILLLLMMTTFVSYASGPSVTASASVNNADRLVTISGTISSGPGQQVTVLVVNPSGGTDYVNQTTSGANGSYEFRYVLDENVGGVYTVTVGGTGVAAPVETAFTYSPASQGGQEAYIDVSASVNNASGLVTISGTISSGPGQQVTVTVINPTGGTDYINQTTSGESGRFSFTYTLDETVGGVYTVTVGGTNVANPVSTTFTYAPDNGDTGGSDPGDEVTPTPTPTPGDSKPQEGKEDKPVLDTKTGEAVLTVTEQDINRAFAEATPDENGTRTVTLDIPAIDGANTYVVRIPANLLASGDSNRLIEVVTELGTIIFPTNILENTEVPYGGTIELVISRADASGLDEDAKAQIGNRPVIDIYFRVNSVAVPWSNSSLPVNVSIPYSPSRGEDKEKIAVWYIDDNGNIVPVYSGKYDSSTGTVTFTTTHFSKYAVAYVDISFEDISNYAWAKREIEVLASKGIIKGTSAARKIFNPSANITRADYAALLVRTLGLTAEVRSNFDDVKKGDYFYEEVGIAKALGITTGIGNNKFAPRAEITRQEMMTMTARALKALNKLTEEGTAADLDKFTDADKIASYAVESAAALVKDGLIRGSDNRLNPEAKAIRAEVAVLMYRIYNK